MGTVRYVIVVHGMGEPRKNETVLQVVNRFACARSGRDWSAAPEVVTLGSATSKTGVDAEGDDERFTPWIEYDNVPADPPPPQAGAFLGLPNRPAEPGKNLRFVDLHWGDLLTESFPHVGQNPHEWSQGVIGRLRRKDEDAAARGRRDERVPPWAIPLLEKIHEGAALLYWITKVRNQKLSDLVFNKFLGDVQVYGEYTQMRGQAVRRFHDVMRNIEAAHKAEKSGHEARYTVIAHSLGTVMAMDALLYAQLKPEIRSGQNEDFPNLPFPGYLSRDEYDLVPKKGKGLPPKLKPVLDTSWIERVDSFVTLGSPIDKFRCLWWFNYEYLKQGDQILRKGLLTPDAKRIRHLNFSEEQDPVGHHLDGVKEDPLFKKVFHTEEDEVYVRHSVPGVAHVKYWGDQKLFDWILHRAVDLRRDERKKPRWFFKSTYWWILTITYELIPLAVLLLAFFCVTGAVLSESLHAAATFGASAYVVLYLGRRVIELSVSWRQITREKAAVRTAGMARYPSRRVMIWWFRVQIFTLGAVWCLLSGFLFGILLDLGGRFGWAGKLNAPKTYLAVGGFVAAAILIHVIFKKQRIPKE